MRFGGLEILVIAGLVLLLWGPKRLPELAGAVKKSKDIIKSDDPTSANNDTLEEGAASAKE